MDSLRHEENYNGNRSVEPNPEQLHLVDLNEFLPEISKWTNVGAIAMLTIFVVGVGLTTVLKYKITVKTPANIRPVGELRVVQSAISGTVQNVAVKDNQFVNQGDAIAFVDDSRLQTQKSQLENSIQQSQLQLNQVDAQLGEINAQILAQINLINRTVSAAYAELGGTQRNYDDQKIKADAEMMQAEANLRLARTQLERLRREKLLSTTIAEAEAAYQLAQTQRDRLLAIANSGAISRNMIEEKQQAVKIAQAKLEKAKSDAKDLWQERQQAVKIAQANFAKARTAVNPDNAAVIVAYERIKQEQARGDATLAALKKERETLVQQRLELQKQLIRNRQELQQVETDLNKSVIRAPITGVILQLKLRNPGQVVQPSEAIAQIAPENAPLEIKTFVSSQDIDKVEVGQRVQMQVSACPYPDYGTLDGIVKTIAPDALPIDQNNPKVLAYEVNIEPETFYVGREGDRQCELQPGMEGRADIITREETVLRFILRKGRLITDL
ncbi:MAG TPA: HlyD family efflux transporter periplasmic adaptor subunit [Nostocaceae cyanobacterium]|nr:HlyD family efflux transporter periplasmic adaptor subunit [Nostocaceae cyanobacterium]